MKNLIYNWLLDYYEDHRWWKEYLCHQGTGQRSPEEETAARETYQREIQKLSNKGEAKKQSFYQNYRGPLAEAKVLWQRLESEAREDARRRYAYQKD